MKVIANRPFRVQMIDDCSDPREEFEIPPGEHTVKRVMSHGNPALPWLLFPEPIKPDTFYIGMPELWLRTHAMHEGIQIEETHDDKIAFLVALNNPIEQWVAFEDVFRRPRPSFMRRQLDEHNLHAAVAALKDDPWGLRGEPNIANVILAMRPMSQYRAISKLGLEYKLNPFTENELRALLD